MNASDIPIAPRRARWGALIDLAATLVVSGCVSPFHDVQSARLVAPGETEITVAYSQPMIFEDDEREKIHDDVGIQLARGVGENSEFRARYELLSYEDETFHVLAAGPKVGLARDRVAIYVPLGFAFGGGIETAETISMHPTLIVTHRLGSNVELNLSGKGLLYFEDLGESDVAFNAGLGLSSDLSRLALRPEVGVLIDTGEGDRIWQAALGLSFAAGAKR